jgi:hypothetical protein
MCVNLSMPEAGFIPPQYFPYEFQVFRILRTEFDKDMLYKRDHCLTFASLPALLRYQQYWPRGSSREGTLAKLRQAPIYDANRGRRGAFSSPERSPSGRPIA